MDRDSKSHPAAGTARARGQDWLELDLSDHKDVGFDVDAFAKRTADALALAELHCGQQVADEVIEQIRAAWEIERGIPCLTT